LEKIANTAKPIILSSGMSSFEELDQTVQFLLNKKSTFSILQCTTAYPTLPENYGLNVIKELRDRYNVTVGYSDHSGTIETCVAATALGAEILEFHIVFDRRQFGPDATSSLTIDEATTLVKSVKSIALALQHPIDKNSNSSFSNLKQIFEKSLAINKDLPAGHLLTFDDLEAKKPKGYGIEASKFGDVIGKKLIIEKRKWDFLTEADIQ
jgi:N-acetylneuraminate synthase